MAAVAKVLRVSIQGFSELIGEFFCLLLLLILNSGHKLFTQNQGKISD